MDINKKQLGVLVIILAITIGTISIVSAYTGTGFTHNIPSSKYLNITASQILDTYNDTECDVEESGVCTKVVDGDTIYLDNGEKIRFVGVNTPEKGVDGYQTSKLFVEKLCLGKTVGIDVDDSKKSDKYGRTLGVVIIDGKSVNEMLLKEGLAEVMYIPPSEFYPYNWAYNSTHTPTAENTDTNTASKDITGTFIGNTNSGKFHEPSCRWVQKMSSSNKITFSSRNEAISQGYQPCKVCNP